MFAINHEIVKYLIYNIKSDLRNDCRGSDILSNTALHIIISPRKAISYSKIWGILVDVCHPTNCLTVGRNGLRWHAWVNWQELRIP